MYQRKSYWFTPEQRMAIVHELETTGMSVAQITEKYGIKGHTTVYRWRKDLQMLEKSCTFAAEKHPQMDDKYDMLLNLPSAYEEAYAGGTRSRG